MILIASQIFIYFFIISPFSYGAQTLSHNQSLSGNQTLISPGGNFEMGFFKPGKSPNYYIGIWYSLTMVNTVPPTTVWVANRDSPISDPFSSRLEIVDSNLVLLDESNKKIWSTNMNSTAATSASVVLNDDGNLVLRYGSNSSMPIWQSLDHPTHTFLPGGKLGYNKLTNTKQSITSWRNSEDPGMGLFSLEMDQNNNQFVLKWNTTVQYWISGSWVERDKVFASIPEMRLKYKLYNFSYVNNENESYFTYSLYNPSIISRLILDVSGQVKQLSWGDTTHEWNMFWFHPPKNCDVYGGCGSLGVCNQQTTPFCNCLTGFKPRSENEWNQSDFASGCVRKTNLTCGRNTEKLDFLMIKVASMPLNSYVTVKGPKECRVACLNSCSCNAYSSASNDCFVWDEELLNLSEDNANGRQIYIKVSSKDLPRHKGNNHFRMAIVNASVAGLVLVLLLLFVIVYKRKRKLVGKTTMEGSLVAFVYKDLQIATKNFSIKLGGGGFGSVFKGVLHDSSIVAVKRLESVSQGDKQFRSEVSTIGTIQHVNLIRLRGFCAEGNNKLLVYDYMPNGSLHSRLFHGKQDDVLNWETRYQIALGTARGLVYLHEKCRDCIIHFDIKPENILLDANFSPNVADFGLAKIIGRDFSRVLTTIRGTAGYLAPEWLTGVAVTAKADVFSYGMMLFELVTGNRNVEESEDSSSFTFFPSLATNVVMRPGGDILSLLDRRLNKDASVEQVTRIFKVAYWCIQDNADARPSMSQVEQILEGVLDVEMPPIPQSVNFFADNTKHL